MCWDERFPPFPETWRGRHVYVRAADDDFQGKTSDHERPDLGTGFVYVGPRDDPRTRIKVLVTLARLGRETSARMALERRSASAARPFPRPTHGDGMPLIGHVERARCRDRRLIVSYGLLGFRGVTTIKQAAQSRADR
jgi:hypothetical protein